MAIPARMATVPDASRMFLFRTACLQLGHDVLAVFPHAQLSVPWRASGLAMLAAVDRLSVIRQVRSAAAGRRHHSSPLPAATRRQGTISIDRSAIPQISTCKCSLVASSHCRTARNRATDLQIRQVASSWAARSTINLSSDRKRAGWSVHAPIVGRSSSCPRSFSARSSPSPPSRPWLPPKPSLRFASSQQGSSTITHAFSAPSERLLPRAHSCILFDLCRRERIAKSLSPSRFPDQAFSSLAPATNEASSPSPRPWGPPVSDNAIVIVCRFSAVLLAPQIIFPSGPPARRWESNSVGRGGRQSQHV